MGVTEWFVENAQWISPVTSIGTMLIWIFTRNFCTAVMLVKLGPTF